MTRLRVPMSYHISNSYQRYFVASFSNLLMVDQKVKCGCSNPLLILYHTFGSTKFCGKQKPTFTRGQLLAIMWGMTVRAVGLPPGYIIAQILSYLVFIARNRINDIVASCFVTCSEEQGLSSPVRAVGVVLAAGRAAFYDSDIVR